MADIRGLPPSYKQYVVARFFEGNYWYWGSWDEWEQAIKVAKRIGGAIFAEEERYDKGGR